MSLVAAQLGLQMWGCCLCVDSEQFCSIADPQLCGVACLERVKNHTGVCYPGLLFVGTEYFVIAAAEN